MKDTLQKFMVDNAPVRGELVELSATWQQVLARRDYPVAVKRLLGEMLSAAALLSATLKFNGVIVMQVHGDGPVKLLVVECDSELRLRATAKVIEGEVVPDDATLTQLVNLNGQGHFAITLDPQDKMPGQQAYQGIVPLDGDDVATVIENYMQRSEQLDTKLWLAADGQVSRGLLLTKTADDRRHQYAGRRTRHLESHVHARQHTAHRRVAQHRHRDLAAAFVLGRNHSCVRSRSSAVSLLMLARKSRQHAENAGA